VVLIEVFFWVGELGVESVLFSWSKVGLMIGKSSMSVSRYCHRHLQCWEYALQCWGVQRRESEAGTMDATKPLFETSGLEEGGSSVPRCERRSDSTIGKFWLHFTCSRTPFRRRPTFTEMTSCKPTQQLEWSKRKTPVVIREGRVASGSRYICLRHFPSIWLKNVSLDHFPAKR
jgi:hypothetical protein